MGSFRILNHPKGMGFFFWHNLIVAVERGEKYNIAIRVYGREGGREGHEQNRARNGREGKDEKKVWVGV